jgi:phosphoribosylformylglycinamidine synthase
VRHATVAGDPPDIDLQTEAALQRFVIELVGEGLVHAAHDCSEGGLLAAVAEMLIVGDVGAALDLDALRAVNGGRNDRLMFGEAASRIILGAGREEAAEITTRAEACGLDVVRLGAVEGDELKLQGRLRVPVAELGQAWRAGF